MTVAMSRAANYTDFKSTFLATLGRLAAGDDMVQISADFLARIESGDVVIPALAKDIDYVIGDIETCGTVVARALVAGQQEA